MEKRLTHLFDYQKFAKNRKLQEVIDSVHAHQAKRQISLDDADLVAAAGTPYYNPNPTDEAKRDADKTV